MIEIISAEVTSTAAPAAFFARWADTATWPEWNQDTEWVRLDGPFRAGATGHFKPKGGPKVRFLVAVLDEREFTDVSLLLGAKLTFKHLVDRTADGRTQVRVEATLDGPLSWLWNRMLGNGIKANLQSDLDRLAHAVENAGTSPTIPTSVAAQS